MRVALNDANKMDNIYESALGQNLIKRSYVELQFASKRLEIYSLEMLRLAEHDSNRT
jgi:hypothetical protein